MAYAVDPTTKTPSGKDTEGVLLPESDA